MELADRKHSSYRNKILTNEFETKQLLSKKKLVGLFYLILLLFCSLINIGCSDNYECDPIKESSVEGSVSVDNCLNEIEAACQYDPGEINIRIRNFSRYDVCGLEYNAYDQNGFYGNIPAGGCSCYISHEKAYRYPAFMKYIDFQRENTLTAIDFVGEEILKPGRYNYNLWVINTPSFKWYRGFMVRSDEDKDYQNAISSQCEEMIPEDCGVDANKVNLRIVNESIFPLCAFSFQNADNEVLSYGNVFSGQTTCYIPINYIDKNNFKIEFSIDGNEFEEGLTVPVWRDIVEEGNYTLYLTLGSLNGEKIVTYIEQE